MPTEAEIAEKATSMGLIELPTRELSSRDRKTVANALINEQREANRPQPPDRATKNLLSRQVIADGERHLIFEVWEQKETAP